MLLEWLLNFSFVVFSFANPFDGVVMWRGGMNAGEQLFLTPYIEAGKIKEARELSKVTSLVGNVESYSGFFTVDKKCKSNLFIWFFPATNQQPDTPVAVWLQGGPGSTSLFGLFSELGPYELTVDNQVKLRKYSWNRVASYLFIDNPVGTGYSFTEDDSCYSKNQEEVGRNLLVAVKQFFQLFPEYKSNPFFVTGESYAGKYVPALAHAIHMDKDPKHKINLQGLSLGNGLVDPVNQINYSDYLYQIGLLDFNEKKIMAKMEEKCRELIGEKKWREASECFDEVVNGDFNPSYMQNVTGYKNYFNFLYPARDTFVNLASFLTTDEVRKAIHVGNSLWHNGTIVESHLYEDLTKSVRPWLEELLEHYRVLIYNGQLDIIVAYPLTEGYLQKLNWSAAAEYKTAKRRIWKVGDEIAGYSKTAGNLREVLVRYAGHMVPSDQPKWAFNLISRFFKNKTMH